MFKQNLNCRWRNTHTFRIKQNLEWPGVFLTSQRILLWDIIRSTTFVVGPDHLSAPRASPDLTATRRAGSSYWSRYCSQFSWWWWWLSACMTKISGSTSYLSHTRCLFSHFPQQEDRQYNVRGLSSDRRTLSQTVTVFRLCSRWDVLCFSFKGPLSNIWLHRSLPFLFFLCSCIQTYLLSRSL